MEIKYLGHSSFSIKGKNTTVITDPYDPDMTGLKLPKHIEADIVTVSHDHPDHNAVAHIDGKPFIIHGAGEYEIKGVSIVGHTSYHDKQKGAERGKNIIYRIEIDNVSIVHLGDLGHTLSTEEAEALDGVDILMIPVGGIFTLDPVSAKTVVSEIEPSIVIPMHYMRPGLSVKTFGQLAPVSEFLKEIGKESVLPQPKLTVGRDKLPEEMQVIILE